MACILVAVTPNSVANLERLLGREHELLSVSTTGEAQAVLETGIIDFIIVGAGFDSSRIFKLIANSVLIEEEPEKEREKSMVIAKRRRKLTGSEWIGGGAPVNKEPV